MARRPASSICARVPLSVEYAARRTSSREPLRRVTAGILHPNGQRVPPDIEGMRALAETTEGKAYESDGAESVSAVYERLGTLVGTERVEREVTAWAVGIAVALLALAGLAGWRLSPRLA